MDPLTRYQPLVNVPDIFRILSALLVFSFLGISNLHGQEDKKDKTFQEIFDEFKISNEQEFDQFRKRNDSVFTAFLKKAWIDYQVFIDPKHQDPKPRDQPRNTEKTVEPIEIVPRKNSAQTIINQKSDPGNTPELNHRLDYDPNINDSGNNMTARFYGHSVRMPEPGIARNPDLSVVNESAISDFHRLIAESDGFKAAVTAITDFSTEKQLNGWSQLQFIQAMSANLFRNLNAKVLFTWMALIHTGFLARVCYSNDQVYLLVPFDVKAYMLYIKADDGDVNYYMVLFPGQEFSGGSVKSYEKYQHPVPLQELSLYMKTLPQLGNSKTTRYLTWNRDTIQLVLNENLLDFYASYPECDLKVTGNAPLSADLQKSLDNFLLGKLGNMIECDKVNTLLEFVQYAISYRTDEQQFGRENYLFPEETLYYPFADCEDRVSLMVQLVKRYTGLKSIGLSYPDHVSMAISFKNSPGGGFVSVSGTKYWVCDPTYLGSISGMLMPAYKNMSPEIIQW